VSLAMQGITEGVQSGIENAKVGSEFQKIKSKLPPGTKNPNIKARQIMRQKDTSLIKVDKSFKGAEKFETGKDYGLKDPTYKFEGADKQYKMQNKAGNITEGDWVIKGSLADKARGGLTGPQSFVEGLHSTKFGADEFAKLIQALTPEESGFDIQSNPMQYIGRYR